MDRRSFLALAGSAAVVPAFAADDKKTIRIVSSLPRTGSAQGQTDTIFNGIVMAIGDYEGKIAGFVIKYTDMDDATVATMPEEFVSDICDILLAMVTLKPKLLTGHEFRHVFKLVAVTAFIGYALALFQMSIWYRRKWSTTIKATVDGAIYALLTAGTFGWLWPR